jgi:hypothetical protein
MILDVDTDVQIGVLTNVQYAWQVFDKSIMIKESFVWPIPFNRYWWTKMSKVGAMPFGWRSTNEMYGKVMSVKTNHLEYFIITNIQDLPSKTQIQWIKENWRFR